MTGQSNNARGVIFDCVGVVLVPSKEYSPTRLVEELDQACGEPLRQAAILGRFASTHSLDASAQAECWHSMVCKYSINHPVLRTIRAVRSNARLALFNNGCPESFCEWVNKFHLQNHFDVLANSFHLGIAKPDPLAFQRVADTLGCAPEQCVVVDDQAVNIAGARVAGCEVIEFSPIHFRRATDLIAELRSRLERGGAYGQSHT